MMFILTPKGNEERNSCPYSGADATEGRQALQAALWQ